jgi:hypothetical protein
MLKILQSQSDPMKNLEIKLAGAKTISWETMTERDRAEAEPQARRRERELTRLRMEIEENDALVAVGQLIDLMQRLGQSERAFELVEQAGELTARARKMHKQRGMRNPGWEERGGMDDWAAQNLLSEAMHIAESLRNDFPNLREELTAIRERINEQLAHFS